MLVAHMNKMKMPDLDGLQMHVERKRDRHSNPDIDVKRSRLNYELTNRDMSQSYFDQVMTEIEEKKTSKRKVRKDALADFDSGRKIQDIAEGLVKNTNITTIKPFSSNKGPRR